MNYVTFSLYGKHPKYLVGAIKNAEQIEQFYPGFKAIFYVNHDVPYPCVSELRKLGAKVIQTAGQFPNPMFCRLAAVSRPNANIVLCRDVDSRFSNREVNAVQAWINSGKLFHIMRDYPAHVLFPGGLWGWRRPLELKLYQWAVNWFRDRRITTYNKMDDQRFLEEIVWPKVSDHVLQHDTFSRDKYPGSVPFPDGDVTGDGDFVGEIFDQDDRIEQVSRDARKRGESAG